MEKLQKALIYRQTLIRPNLALRARILAAIRDFFAGRGYLEVETPIRIPAPAPEAHIEAEPAGDWYLHTSPELCMKRLLAAGYPRIFQICRCFRKQERGSRHLPEFTLLEWYAAGMDYTAMMAFCEDLVGFVARVAGFGRKLRYGGREIHLSTPWKRMTVTQAFDAFGSMSVFAALEAGRFDELMGLEIEPRIGFEPVFLVDYPAPCAALARLKPENPAVAERFELYMGGLEICNAFRELVDPQEQRWRFEQEQAVRRRAGKPVYPSPEPFLEALGHMPEASGNALGIDRLVMLFADAESVDEVVAFTPEEL